MMAGEKCAKLMEEIDRALESRYFGGDGLCWLSEKILEAIVVCQSDDIIVDLIAGHRNAVDSLRFNYWAYDPGRRVACAERLSRVLGLGEAVKLWLLLGELAIHDYLAGFYEDHGQRAVVDNPAFFEFLLEVSKPYLQMVYNVLSTLVYFNGHEWLREALEKVIDSLYAIYSSEALPILITGLSLKKVKDNITAIGSFMAKRWVLDKKFSFTRYRYPFFTVRMYLWKFLPSNILEGDVRMYDYYSEQNLLERRFLIDVLGISRYGPKRVTVAFSMKPGEKRVCVLKTPSVIIDALDVWRAWCVEEVKVFQ